MNANTITVEYLQDLTALITKHAANLKYLHNHARDGEISPEQATKAVEAIIEEINRFVQP